MTRIPDCTVPNHGALYPTYIAAPCPWYPLNNQHPCTLLFSPVAHSTAPYTAMQPCTPLFSTAPLSAEYLWYPVPYFVAVYPTYLLCSACTPDGKQHPTLTRHLLIKIPVQVQPKGPALPCIGKYHSPNTYLCTLH